MQTLHIGAELLKSTGGTTKAVADFEKALPDSIVMALCDSGKLAGEGPYDPTWNYVPTSESLLGRHYFRITAEEVAKALDTASGVAAVFSHMLHRYNSNLAARIAHKYGVPYFAVPHGSLDPWVFSYRTWQKKAWLHLFGKNFLQQADAVVFATKREYEKARRAVDLDNGVVIHWPVDVFGEADLDIRNTRKAFGLPEKARLLISFGRLHSVKRPLELIGVFNALGRTDVGLVLVGPDDDVTLTQCRARAAETEAENVFCFSPKYGDDLWELVRACDGYISWSHKENFNYTLAESLGIGLPVIVSQGNDLALELADVDCGWMLKDDSEWALRKALEEFAATPDGRLKEMGMRANRFAQESLSRDAFAKSLQRLVMDSVGRGKSRNAQWG